MMNASFGIKGFFDYIPEPYSKFLQRDAYAQTIFQKRSSVKAKPEDMMFLLMTFMLLY